MVSICPTSSRLRHRCRHSRPVLVGVDRKQLLVELSGLLSWFWWWSSLWSGASCRTMSLNLFRWPLRNDTWQTDRFQIDAGNRPSCLSTYLRRWWCSRPAAAIRSSMAFSTATTVSHVAPGAVVEFFKNLNSRVTCQTWSNAFLKLMELRESSFWCSKCFSTNSLSWYLFSGIPTLSESGLLLCQDLFCLDYEPVDWE